ncbi:MAG: tRNA 2-selenouridine(34) synthase MnmH [Ginsengibacter sp.]
MPVERIDIDYFLKLSETFPVLDVRSPAEYQHARIPGAFSVPIFSDEERKIIGTAYTKESRQIAVDHGLEFFSERMKNIHEEVKNIIRDWENKNHSHVNTLLVHCWRGGMRSDAVAWLLNLYGYKIFVLKGGYKAFRRWALLQFEKKYSLKILGGFTGSGKTEVLRELKENGKTVIDLEGLANHKGSAFGSLGGNAQPSHEMFENLLAIELWKIETGVQMNNEIWIEDESVHIGRVGIPKIFWQQMRESQLYFLEIPFEERVKYISRHYGKFHEQELIECILKIQKRLGGLDTKNAIQFLNEGNYSAAFSILLKYYDKMYHESLHNRAGIDFLLNKIICEKVEAKNAGQLIDE